MKSVNNFLAVAALGVTAFSLQGAVVLTGDTSEPRTSTFILGERVGLSFHASGGSAHSSVNLLVSIVDEHGKVVDRKTLDMSFDAHGKGKVALEAPGGLGFYRVNATLDDGTKLSALGSRPAGCLTYAVVRPPSERKAVTEKEAFFGMQGGYGPNGGMLMERLGIRWILDSSLNWNRNEPKAAGEFKPDPDAGPSAPANPNWETFALPTLFHVPSWAVVPETEAYDTGRLTPDGEMAWEAYCRKAAAEYMVKYPNRMERIYQITWEPNPPWGFKGRDEDLVRIYEIAYRALHDTDPRAVVAGPTRSLETDEFDKIERLFSKGLGQYLDAFSIHPYFSLDAEQGGLLREIRALKAVVGNQKNGKLELMGTEQGGSTWENPDKEINQARGLMRQNLIMKGEGFRMNFAFYIVDYRTKSESGYGYYFNLVDGVPWGPAKMSPKPVAAAYAAQSFLLEGYEPVGVVEWLGGSTLGYAFQRGEDTILALWDFRLSGNKVSLPTGVDRVRVYDWMGREKVEDCPNGTLSISLGPEPLYVRGVSPQLWSEREEKILSLEAGAPEIYFGDKGGITVKISNPFGHPINGELALTADSRIQFSATRQTIALPPGEQKSFHFAFEPGTDSSPGTASVRVTLEESGRTVANSGMLLNLVPAVEVVRVRPYVDSDGGKGLKIEICDKKGSGFQGEMQWELRNHEESGTAIVEVEPGGTKVVEIDLRALKTSPDLSYPFRLSLNKGGDLIVTKNAVVNFLGARRNSVPSRTSERVASPLTQVMLAKRNLIRAPESYNDGEAVLRWGWDDKALYLTADISDKTQLQTYMGENAWRGDSLQLAFNLDPEKATLHTGNQVADLGTRQRITEITIFSAHSGAAAYRQISFDPEKLPLGPVSMDDLQVSRKTSDGHSLYNITIPWRSLGATAPPVAGDMIGVAATVNDISSKEQREPSSLGLFGGIHPQKDSTRFGQLVLMGEEK